MPMILDRTSRTRRNGVDTSFGITSLAIQEPPPLPASPRPSKPSHLCPANEIEVARSCPRKRGRGRRSPETNRGNENWTADYTEPGDKQPSFVTIQRWNWARSCLLFPSFLFLQTYHLHSSTRSELPSRNCPFFPLLSTLVSLRPPVRPANVVDALFPRERRRERKLARICVRFLSLFRFSCFPSSIISFSFRLCTLGWCSSLRNTMAGNVNVGKNCFFIPRVKRKLCGATAAKNIVRERCCGAADGSTAESILDINLSRFFALRVALFLASEKRWKPPKFGETDRRARFEEFLRNETTVGCFNSILRLFNLLHPHTTYLINLY